jgi:hypothetical protein
MQRQAEPGDKICSLRIAPRRVDTRSRGQVRTGRFIGAAQRRGSRKDGTSLEAHYGGCIDWRRTDGIGDAGARCPGLAHGARAVSVIDELYGPAPRADALGGSDADSCGYLVGIARGTNGNAAQGMRARSLSESSFRVRAVHCCRAPAMPSRRSAGRNFRNAPMAKPLESYRSNSNRNDCPAFTIGNETVAGQVEVRWLYRWSIFPVRAERPTGARAFSVIGVDGRAIALVAFLKGKATPSESPQPTVLPKML